jgi:hypothetical protein
MHNSVNRGGSQRFPAQPCAAVPAIPFRLDGVPIENPVWISSRPYAGPRNVNLDPTSWAWPLYLIDVHQIDTVFSEELLRNAERVQFVTVQVNQAGLSIRAVRRCHDDVI